MGQIILLIDNDEYSTTKIEEYLDLFGFQITSTKNGQFGLSTLRSQKPDIILLSDGVTDIDIPAFLERKKKMMGVEDIPVIIFTKKTQLDYIKLLIQSGAKDTLTRPIVLERLQKKIFQHLHIPEKSGKQHLTTEVFIREGIIIIEIGGFLNHEEIIALKYRILDTARTDQTIRKRFYFILYNLEEENFSQILFNKLFAFISSFPRLPESNVKILTSNEIIMRMIKNSPVASKFEIVDNYIDGLNKLKSLYLVNEDNEVLVDFLKPNIALFKSVYDQKGILVKEEGSSFSSEEIQQLLRRGIKKLYYTRKAKVGSDKQILESEDVDVVMDSIKVSGIVVPQELTDLSVVDESKKQHGVHILIVNGNQKDLQVLKNFFAEKGFITSQANTSKDAIKYISTKSYEYIIIDIDLDNGNGLNLVKTLKLNPHTKQSNFIITGQIVTNESVEQAIHLGVRGFLKSPFDPAKLSKIISSL